MKVLIVLSADSQKDVITLCKAWKKLAYEFYQILFSAEDMFLICQIQFSFDFGFDFVGIAIIL